VVQSFIIVGVAIRYVLPVFVDDVAFAHDRPSKCDELGPNKFRERLSGAACMKENLLAVGAPPRTPLGELTVLLQIS